MSSEISIHNFTVHGHCILLLYLILDGRAEEELLADPLCVFRRLDLMTDCSGVYKDFIIVSSLFEKKRKSQNCLIQASRRHLCSSTCTHEYTNELLVKIVQDPSSQFLGSRA